MKSRYLVVFAILYLILAEVQYRCLAQEPYKLGVQENIQGMPNANSAYPAPQMILTPGAAATQRTPSPKPPSTFSGNASQFTNRVNQETFSSGVTAVALPPPFLGVWQVHGQRTAVQALPEFQASAEQAFTPNNDQIWNISGNQAAGYTLGSNTGISTALIVDKIQGNTAFVRYQHPVGKTMAQEAIVMSLLPGGRQFEGLERISIVKEGLPQPRAKVTYQLNGTRQR